MDLGTGMLQVRHADGEAGLHQDELPFFHSDEGTWYGFQPEENGINEFVQTTYMPMALHGDAVPGQAPDHGDIQFQIPDPHPDKGHTEEFEMNSSDEMPNESSDTLDDEWRDGSWLPHELPDGDELPDSRGPS